MNEKTGVEKALDAMRKGDTYNADVAYLCSVVSTWCYAPPKTLQSVLGRKHWWPDRPLKIEEFSVHNPALMVDSNAFLSHFGQKMEEQLHVLAFRGTEPTNIIDWFTDALIEPHDWEKDQWVHRGFFLGLDVLWPELLNKLDGLPGRLVITGHSLGGALAALAARRFADERGKAIPTYTFGQPMVGNKAFADASNDKTLFRHVYNGDLVARLPPTPLGEGYLHYGVALRPGKAGTGMDVDKAQSSVWPPPAHLPDLPPAVLSLITAPGRRWFASYSNP